MALAASLLARSPAARGCPGVALVQGKAGGGASGGHDGSSTTSTTSTTNTNTSPGSSSADAARSAAGSGGAGNGSSSSSAGGGTSTSSSTSTGDGSGGDGTPQRPIVLHIRQQDGTAGLGAAGNELMRRAGAALLAGASHAAARLNELTGYNVIERLKAQVDQADDGLAAARQELRAAKALYEQRQAQHSDVQRQLMSLLQRKGSWAAADVERFAGLCRDEHGLEGSVAAAKAAYGSAAEGLESAHAALLRSIRERYAAETLWSDKIRRASTWWTAGLMGLHLASFLSVYLVMEPIKAARLRDHVEGVLRTELAAVRSSVGQLQNTLDSHVAEFEEVEASARAAAGVAVAAAGTAVAGAAAAGLPAAAFTGSAGQRKAAAAAAQEQPTAEASAAAVMMGPEMLALRQRLEGVERRVGEVVGALTAQTAALRAQAAAAAQQVAAAGPGSGLLPQSGPAAGASRGACAAAAGQGFDSSSSSTATTAAAGAEVEVEVEDGRGAGAVARRWGRRGVRWGRALVAALAKAVDAPEAATGAAAFAGAALGVGLALWLSGAPGR
ncbi:hypothetical protein HYH02_013182 [Chlamydomonas schloesseri]|uniref:Sensitive to high expression protein 9, mitochondrial n=1 Tax=Chlamydomonas schloesseri TaxID=2026947 RepID=A0A835W0U4_9CHLO|nr:hypothetical protein HYH02_013182 [Chlamydomonas schloesseri]|eukprot:KAG2431966.1 hypothetical protein HYH02_013182 [Chlamydomonas schloesseri]